jgi:lipoyl(octanoyl) transferase
LASYDIKAYAKADAPGVYVDEAKVASLGLRVRKGCSFHGLSLNVDMDMEPFLRINPCGYAGMAMCQTKLISGPQTVAEAGDKLSEILAASLSTSEIIRQTGLPTK